MKAKIDILKSLAAGKITSKAAARALELLKPEFLIIGDVQDDGSVLAKYEEEDFDPASMELVDTELGQLVRHRDMAAFDAYLEGKGRKHRVKSVVITENNTEEI